MPGAGKSSATPGLAAWHSGGAFTERRTQKKGGRALARPAANDARGDKSVWTALKLFIGVFAAN